MVFTRNSSSHPFQGEKWAILMLLMYLNVPLLGFRVLALFTLGPNFLFLVKNFITLKNK
jgi:hypothetical protein